jgi:putative glycosyltransferase (TIGR04372 family)
MLDILFRMRQLGWWTGKAIMLPNIPKLIANRALLALYENEGPILLQGVDVDGWIVEELISLQRYCGLSFNVFRFPDGTVVPWQDAGALLLQQWEKERRPLPLRVAFDTPGSAGEFAADAAAEAFEQWGLDKDDWYVCLHMRDASHYGETSGLGQTHRNAGVANYISAIEYVIGLGGKVIRLGGARAPDLPVMDGLIDYARSIYKSELLDLWLIRNCRFFIGTTSGLTNVAISFGIPCALVNCITTDAQLWHKDVRFAPKTILVAGGGELSQNDLTSTPWRWRVFSAETLLHHNATAYDNTADEILETVKEVYALAWNTVYETQIADPDGMRRLWRSCLSFPHFYGAALPSLYYLHRHFHSFLEDKQEVTDLSTVVPQSRENAGVHKLEASSSPR